MGTITDKLTYLQDTKTSIKNAIVSKGVSVSDSDTFRSYANKISSITTGGSSDEWQPQSDWWDIDSILENDTENYVGKIIILLPNSEVSTVIKARFMNNVYPAKIKTSDGMEYTNVTSDKTHTWDISKDKECSSGYSTRYVIYYYEQSSAVFAVNLSSYPIFGNSLYMIVQNMNLTTTNQNYLVALNMYKFKMINGSLAPTTLKLGNMKNIRKIIGLDLSNVTDLDNFAFNSFYAYDFFKDYGEQWNTSNVTNFNNAFNATGLRYIPSLDFTNASNISNMFNTATNLINIGEISNIKITGINLTQAINLNHDTLLRFLNALYDYAAEGNTGTFTLTLGTTNLNKLTDEEKAIATNKGWTLS